MNDGSFSIAILDDQNSPPTSGSGALDGSGTFEGLTGGFNVAIERVRITMPFAKDVVDMMVTTEKALTVTVMMWDEGNQMVFFEVSLCINDIPGYVIAC